MVPTARSPGPQKVTVHVEEGVFQFTHSQLHFDSPNLFTRRLSREPYLRAFYFDDPERPDSSGDFELIQAYLSGLDIVGGGTAQPQRRRFALDEALIVTSDNFQLVWNDAEFFQLGNLQTMLKELEKGWRPLLPAYPLEGGRFALLTGPLSFRRALREGGVDGQKLMDIIKRDKGPFPLFQFSEIILSVQAYRGSVDYWITFRHHEVRRFIKTILSLHFRHEDRSNSTLRVSPYSHRASKAATIQVDNRPPERIYTFSQWLLASHDTAAYAIAPRLEKHLGYLVDTRSSSAKQEADFSAASAMGFWRKGELHVFHWVLDGEQKDCAGLVVRQPGW
ncbi:hypothetical protein P7C70_g4356, partial [Phenoliferia sp. Uapishka_3]